MGRVAQLAAVCDCMHAAVAGKQSCLALLALIESQSQTHRHLKAADVRLHLSHLREGSKCLYAANASCLERAATTGLTQQMHFVNKHEAYLQCP